MLLITHRAHHSSTAHHVADGYTHFTKPKNTTFQGFICGAGYKEKQRTFNPVYLL